MKLEAGGRAKLPITWGKVMLYCCGKMEQLSYSQLGRKVMQCCRRKAELGEGGVRIEQGHGRTYGMMQLRLFGCKGCCEVDWQVCSGGKGCYLGETRGVSETRGVVINLVTCVY